MGVTMQDNAWCCDWVGWWRLDARVVDALREGTLLLLVERHDTGETLAVMQPLLLTVLMLLLLCVTRVDGLLIGSGEEGHTVRNERQMV